MATKSGTWAALDRARAGEFGADDAPEDSFTLAEYAERYAVSSSTANGQLKRLVRAGQLKSGHKQVVRIDGKRIRAIAYWVANDPVDRLAGRRTRRPAGVV